MILCLETSATICSVALSDRGSLISIRESSAPNDHASVIMKHIDGCLKEAGIALEEIEAIAISQGPGSFTGLRVGVSAAKGLCFALGIPLIAISTLSGIAYRAFHHHPEAIFAIPMIEARKNEVYGAIYRPDMTMELKDQVITLYPNWHLSILPEGSNLVFCGPGSQKYQEINHPSPLQIDVQPPSAKNLVDLAFEKHIKKDYCVTKSFHPNYLKSPHITQPRKVL
ncbi:MAG: tRNA (adenosine(37)-N6)-threonylcarbamoyltransferase complex dimerization subunit type 1 TsaB [Saprospiraceae bacterium]|nr:tRNA (adenosine(37)-N6)-threonylcarbamoyltransferase complex dimerization subunit type 1 TsaB [Saprospiraceae bacterium]